VSAPHFFESAAQFRRWLEAHHDSATEIVVGFHRKATGNPTMSWPESVREALCFGWIDGVVKRLDDERYTRRFTPRTARSIWSAVNIRHVESLLAEGRMMPAGIRAFESRSSERSAIYSFEQDAVVLPEAFAATFRTNGRAFQFFERQSASYRKAVIWWIVSAKQDATRRRRLSLAIAHSERHERVPQFT
jgi:uncharacterized protein YdeI (YjbR/CyaY-like superfamily)